MEFGLHFIVRTTLGLLPVVFAPFCLALEVWTSTSSIRKIFLSGLTESIRFRGLPFSCEFPTPAYLSLLI